MELNLILIISFALIIFIGSILLIGDFAEQETRLGQTQNGMTFKQNTKGEIVQGYFALKHLVLFSKCTNLCQNIEIYLKNDYPLIIRYNVANLGEVKFCLAPKNNDD